jgi:hypothetical protein
MCSAHACSITGNPPVDEDCPQARPTDPAEVDVKGG